MISRHMEGQESYESDPSQGKLQKDLDYVHIPMYATIGVISAYVRGYRGKSRVYHFSYVFGDDQGHIKRQKVVHRGSGTWEGHTMCDSPSVVKSTITVDTTHFRYSSVLCERNYKVLALGHWIFVRRDTQEIMNG